MKYIFQQHQFLENLLGKYGFYKDHVQIDEAIKFASLSRFQELYGDDAEYAPGVPLPRRAYQLTQNISDKLQPFLREVLAAANPSTIPTITRPPDADIPATQTLTDRNVFVLPDGWVHPTAMHYIASIDELDEDLGNYIFPLGDVKVLDDDKVGKRRRSKMVAPNHAHPIAQIISKGYRLFPLPDGLFYAKYLGLPTAPLYAVDFVEESGEYVYNDGNSQDTGWPEIEHNDLMMKAGELLGVPLQDVQLMNFTRYKAQMGA